MPKIVWTNEMINFVKNNVDKYNNQTIADIFGKSKKSVVAIMLRNGIKRTSRDRKKFMKEWRKFPEKNPNWKGGLKKDKEHQRSLQLKHTKDYNNRHPKRKEARSLAQGAIKTGLIKKHPCGVCKNPISQSHHEDYDKPLEVIFLCRKHHLERHDETNRIGSQ